jgi:uncharacterized phage protein gp47/JayE
MAVRTQQELALQMLAQLRRLDSSVSAEIGTPERKIIDTVAEALADAQIDLSVLQSGLDVDSKFGDELDRFLSLFGFGRQKATYATGFITFSRTAISTLDITIPTNVAIRVPFGDTIDEVTGGIVFYTTQSVTLAAGSTSVVAPIRCAIAGTTGNVAANTITEMVASPIFGITGITNEIATSNGIDGESDNELKVRFRNTVFRNLAGTRDQYLALAVSTQYSLKANVIGPQSTWTEYMQIPPVDDNTGYDINDDGTSESGGGLAGEYTTALSALPYAKAIWTSLPVYVSNGVVGPGSYFYRPDVDFRFNLTSTTKARGDALRLSNAYGALAPNPLTLLNRPNLTFTNVYTGTNPDIQIVRPNDTVLIEYTYLSDASRNDLDRNVTNCVDVYVDGGNDQNATTILSAPSVASAFVDNPASKFHYENFRRAGQPFKRPMIGNLLMPLYWQPVSDVPSEIIVGDNTYTLGVHYWHVKEVSEVGGSWRARSGIEWSSAVKGTSTTTARYISDWVGVNFAPITIEDYMYDQNIVDLQAALEGSRQITADVLAHKSLHRFFKFDITVMYTRGANTTEVNLAIRDAVDRFLKSQYFGTILQLSDVLDVIHNVSGVDNVRWSSDLPNNEDLARAYECDDQGRPLLDLTVERQVVGDASTVEKQKFFLTGQPVPYVWSFNSTTGTSAQVPSYLVFQLGSSVSANISINTTNLAGAIQTGLQAVTGLGSVTVVEDGRSTSGVKDPIRSFTVTFPANGTQSLITAIPHLKGGPTVIFNDFALRDNELAALPTGTQTTGYYGSNDTLLPSDTVPGFIIRTRAQNTFLRS